MLDAFMQILKGVLEFLGVVANPQGKKVEEILPEKSASEQALEDLQKGAPKSAGPLS